MENTQQEIQHLVNSLTAKPDDQNKLADSNVRCNLVRRLLGYGRDVVKPILTKLRILKEDGKLRIIPHVIDLLVMVLLEVAEPQDAQALANMLLWDEITLDMYGLTRLRLVITLGEIGNASMVPPLKALAKRITEAELRRINPTKDDKNDYELDQKRIAEAIAACKERPAPTA